MFQREKKAVFPFILLGLFDPEGLGAGAGLHYPASLRNISFRKKIRSNC
ncbi:hypothetical protein ACQCVP_05690 [Rossellomorea vietnamensis]